MKDKDISELTQMRDQLLRLRNDDGIIEGISIHTLAGDIRISMKETALLVTDFLISDIQKHITYLMKHEKSS